MGVATFLVAVLVGILLLSASASWPPTPGPRIGGGHKISQATVNPPVPGEDKTYWREEAQETLRRQLNLTNTVRKAKNIIFFLGDGMGVGTITAARILKGSQTGRWERESLSWEDFPHSAHIKTYNTNSQVVDSASSATAFLCGVKGNLWTVGVDANVLQVNCTDALNETFHTDSIAKWFQDAGRSAGFVTTTRVTHATPAGAYAHSANRGWEDDAIMVKTGQDPDVCDDIAEQLILKDPGNKFKVIMGGGRQRLLPQSVIDVEEGVGGYRLDGKDLISMWKSDKDSKGVSSAYVWNREDLLALDTANTDYLLGLFAYSHMDYLLDRKPKMDPSLPEMTKAAIEVLRRDENGYFLMVEGGRIDQAHHENKARKALTETLEFDEAVQMALAMTDPLDTLIIVTVDHAQPLTINGYPNRHNDILGVGDVSGVDNIPYTALLYGNGPGYDVTEEGKRPDPSKLNLTDSNYRQTAAIPQSSSYHSGEDVGLWVTGPHSHLFTGVYEQNYIAHALAYAACVGEGLTFCDERKSNGTEGREP
uniref:Alkaline phosphatase n=1 Tax=Macrobrachium nipponense TaxID=159736 RepID=A0A6G7QD57_MACNP|nr:alkaline phosphatase [Macrobrachium nipponense]